MKKIIKNDKLVFFAVMVMFLSFILLSVGRITDAKPVSLQASLNPVIIIDAGHGGADGGAVGVDGIVEKDINLNISLKLRDMLKICGYDVVMVREDDRLIYDEGVTGIRNQKSSDLVNRLNFTKNYPNSVFISVHQNQFRASSCNGTQIFYSPNNPQSEDFAAITQRMFVEMLQPDNTRQQKAVGDNIFILYKAQTPAIMVECGFLSNYKEAYKLIDPEYQSQIAFVVNCSTLEYLNTRDQNMQTD